MPKSLHFLVVQVVGFQYLRLPECLSSWKFQGIDLKNGYFLYLAAFSKVSCSMLYNGKIVIVLIVTTSSLAFFCGDAGMYLF